MSIPSVVSKLSPINNYKWGNNCDAWTLVDNKEFTVKHESMPPDAEEILHYHNNSLQFFYILKGKAVFEVDDIILIVLEGEGINIEPRRKHRIMNKGENMLEFIVISQPSTANDRQNIV